MSPNQLLKKKYSGFSLIELVVAVAVLAILSAVAIPSFLCFQRKSQATAALATLKQIQSECEINELSETQNVKFTPKNLNSYQIQSDGSNSCGGASGTGLISAIPIDTSKLPTFILVANTSELTYEFKGIKGNSISECLPLICGTSTLIHDPNLDPIQGAKCTQFRTSMVRNGKVETGCYGDPHPDSANGWYPDPCAQTPQGCRSTSFYTNYGWYPCTAGEDEFNFKMPAGFPETKSRKCNAFNPEPPPRNCYCYPPRDNCTCD